MNRAHILFAAASLAVSGLALQTRAAPDDADVRTGRANKDLGRLEDRQDLDPREDVVAIRISEEEVPAVARNAMNSARGEGAVEQITRVRTDQNRTFYRVRLSDDRFLRIAENGKILEEGKLTGGQRAVQWDQLPQAARQAISARHGRGDIRAITQVRDGNYEWYIVNLKDGRTIRVDEHGKQIEGADQPVYLGEVGSPPDATASVPGVSVPGVSVPGAGVPGASVPGAGVPAAGSDPLAGARETDQQKIDWRDVPRTVRNVLDRHAGDRRIAELNEVTYEVRRFSAIMEDRNGERRRVWLDEQGLIVREEDLPRQQREERQDKR